MFSVPLRALALTVLLVGVSAAQDKKADPPPPKAKGFLPQGWKALGLTADQRQMVYKTQTKFNAQIDTLKAQIEKLKAEEKEELAKVLTPEQKKKLIETKTGAAPAPEKPKEK